MEFSQTCKKVFITGGAGFIGSHIVDFLVKNNCQIVIFDNLSSGKKDFLKNCLGKKNVTFIQGDLLHPPEIKNALQPDIDIVFHLGANPDISKGIIDPTIDFQQTIIATFNLLLEIKEKHIKHIVYFSGSGVYGDVGEIYTKEIFSPLFPVSMYGASKLSAEALISAFVHLYDMNAWIFRPANIIGDRATHGVIFDFINKLKKNPNSLQILGDGKQSKSYVYISDLIHGIFLALQNSQDTINVFNIASDSFITVNEIADLIIKEMNLKNVEISHTSGNVGWPGDIPIVRLDNKKLKNLGWKEEYSSQEAVEKTIKDLLLKLVP